MATDKEVLSKLIKRMKHKEVDPLRPLLDEYWMKRDKSPARYLEHTIRIPDRPRPGGRLPPSSMGGCQRQAAFKFLGVRGRQKKDPDLQSTFDDGVWRHHRWNVIFLDMEQVLGRDRFRVVSIEQGVAIPNLYIAGTLDTVIWIKGFGKLLVDFKGINDRGFGYVTTHDEPKEEHVEQITTYLRARRLPRGLLLYENKNNQLTRSHLVTFDERIWHKVRDWCREVIYDIQRKRLPPMHPDCSGGNYLWEKCPFSHLCYGSKTPSQVRRLAYKNFEGLDKAWERGVEDANVE